MASPTSSPTSAYGASYVTDVPESAFQHPAPSPLLPIPEECDPADDHEHEEGDELAPLAAAAAAEPLPSPMLAPKRGEETLVAPKANPPPRITTYPEPYRLAPHDDDAGGRAPGHEAYSIPTVPSIVIDAPPFGSPAVGGGAGGQRELTAEQILPSSVSSRAGTPEQLQQQRASPAFGSPVFGSPARSRRRTATVEVPAIEASSSGILTSLPDPRPDHVERLREYDPTLFEALRSALDPGPVRDAFDALLLAPRSAVPDAMWGPRLAAYFADAPSLLEALMSAVGWIGPDPLWGAPSGYSASNAAVEGFAQQYQQQNQYPVPAPAWSMAQFDALRAPVTGSPVSVPGTAPEPAGYSDFWIPPVLSSPVPSPSPAAAAAGNRDESEGSASPVVFNDTFLGPAAMSPLPVRRAPGGALRTAFPVDAIDMEDLVASAAEMSMQPARNAPPGYAAAGSALSESGSAPASGRASPVARGFNDTSGLGLYHYQQYGSVTSASDRGTDDGTAGGSSTAARDSQSEYDDDDEEEGGDLASWIDLPVDPSEVGSEFLTPQQLIESYTAMHHSPPVAAGGQHPRCGTGVTQLLHHHHTHHGHGHGHGLHHHAAVGQFHDPAHRRVHPHLPPCGHGVKPKTTADVARAARPSGGRGGSAIGMVGARRPPSFDSPV
ncbi:hypothetical protein H9P43_002301 [Blastocladiella emersonii ATCC 22665]|nr:hypothetical protein H9P43_002301 [Blastocladiella emersonii ATCC 22665]